MKQPTKKAFNDFFKNKTHAKMKQKGHELKQCVTETNIRYPLFLFHSMSPFLVKITHCVAYQY